MSHRSKELDAYIGQNVVVEFKKGNPESGVLYHNYKGIQGYCLKTPECDVIFCKTLVRKIEVQE